jgi:hypothetical protein
VYGINSKKVLRRFRSFVPGQNSKNLKTVYQSDVSFMWKLIDSYVSVDTIIPSVFDLLVDKSEFMLPLDMA